MDFLDLAKQRYSERFFDSRPIEQEKLDKILEAGRVVPTACNYQPQHFYVIRSQEGLARLRQVTHFHYNVPVMLLVCYDAREVWRNPGDRYYQNYNSGEQDASIAATTMMYEAEELGVHTCVSSTGFPQNRKNYSLFSDLEFRIFGTGHGKHSGSGWQFIRVQ